MFLNDSVDDTKYQLRATHVYTDKMKISKNVVKFDPDKVSSLARGFGYIDCTATNGAFCELSWLSTNYAVVFLAGTKTDYNMGQGLGVRYTITSIEFKFNDGNIQTVTNCHDYAWRTVVS